MPEIAFAENAANELAFYPYARNLFEISYLINQQMQWEYF